MRTPAQLEKRVHSTFAYVRCRMTETDVESDSARLWSRVQDLPQATAAVNTERGNTA